jgi:hypothetical protein
MFGGVGGYPPRKTPDELADGVRAREEELQRSMQRARRDQAWLSKNGFALILIAAVAAVILILVLVIATHH